jgi:thiol-disulfide isomerase/thioredoxin
MKRLVLIILSLVFIGGIAEAQFKLSGKIRTLRPVTITLSDLNDKLVFQKNITSGVEFDTEISEIKSDYYILKIGELKKQILLENTPITIKGFLDDKNADNTSLVFEGASLNSKLDAAIDEFKLSGRGGWNWDRVKDKYPAIVLSAIVYDNYKYFLVKPEIIIDLVTKIKEAEKESIVVKKLEEMKSKTDHFSIGSNLINFNLPDKDGKYYNTADFKGKFILLDFWASWCGPCRAEMKSLHKIYEEIKGDDLVFISISLDDDKTKWLNSLEADKIPWLALWDSDGFDKSKFKEQFGFSSIPFIVLVDKTGRLIARKLRGDNVKNEIEKQRKNN